ncbi:glycosyl transferase, family 2 [Magnetococcus marinus MC-1]|uniref:Glycosyl transferase, family 2 n=1 Tax=Magnetococcus marinus (strain ATCC BAA-1437 / JCM 17883 / MC-1) TaxID=156889 RepID=A0L8Z6_MAGMM|nr:glycosyltransferase [Magnetococcus marinus]ABK44439.1 glycosyl transferase, family 2 [Magnetococcus marinus MC-1]
MTESPAISVLMSAYNSEAHLGAAVESILAQTERTFEFLLLDDGSSDASWALIQQFARRDPRIQALRNPHNMGLTKTLNRGLRLAKGTYIARLDADDIALPQRLQLQKAFLDQHPAIDVVGGAIQCFIDEQGNPLPKQPPPLVVEPWAIAWQTRLRAMLIHPAVMFRREAILAIGGYDENYPYSQDFALWGEAALLGRLANLSTAVIQSRQAPSRISCRHQQQQQILAQRIAQRNLTPYWPEPTPPTLADIERLRFLIQFIPQHDAQADFSRALKLLQSFQNFCQQHPGPASVQAAQRDQLAAHLLAIIPLHNLAQAWQSGLLPALLRIAPRCCFKHLGQRLQRRLFR